MQILNNEDLEYAIHMMVIKRSMDERLLKEQLLLDMSMNRLIINSVIVLRNSLAGIFGF